MLRDYQQRTIDQLYEWFAKGNKGHPCLVLPTGSGKSHIVAALCKDALQNWPETRVLMLTHVKELIEQNAEKMRLHWPNAPMGVYSASLRAKQLGEPITFAGIQSIRDKADQIGHVDLIVIDECHLVSHKDEGGYRKLIEALTAINPRLRVIGLTATPYRLGHGFITDQPALFSDLIEPVTIEELIYKGYLAPLRSKVTDAKLDTTGVHKRGGEYIEKELQEAVNTTENNVNIVEETIRRGSDRKAWLLFCAGVRHAEAMAEELEAHGIPSACVTGKTPMAERNRIIGDFKDGRIRALTNANVLTTGFDYPDIDLIVMARPTMSASLYVQMAGRGMRPKSEAADCLVLDFAGVVQTHGPITAIDSGRKAGTGGDAPVKVCEVCEELNPIAVSNCIACGHPFPIREKVKPKLHDDDIMGLDVDEKPISTWTWRKHISQSSGKEMLRVSYYAGLVDSPIHEYLPVLHEGYAGQKAMKSLALMAQKAGVDDWSEADDLDDLASRLNRGRPPSMIAYRMDGKFHRVTRREWT